MSTRSRRTRNAGHDHAHGLFNVKEPIRSTETPVQVKASKVTFSDATIPRCEPPTINSVLYIPDCPYGLDEVHFLLWYTFTTTLSPDKIAELFNHFFSPAQPIDRWAIADIVNVLETRWEANGKTFGSGFRLRRPTANGTCPCDFKDFDINCVDVKRTTKTRQSQKYLSLAASLWDESAVDLVLCPRGNRKGQSHPMATRETPPLVPFTTKDELATLLRTSYVNTILPVRAVLTATLWLGILHLWTVPPETLTFPIQRSLSYYLHSHLTSALAVLHVLFESTLDDLPTFAHLRATPFGELARQAFIRLWRVKVAIGIALELCSIFGILPDLVPPHPTGYMRWTTRIFN
jgi:hypothetical protein